MATWRITYNTRRETIGERTKRVVTRVTEPLVPFKNADTNAVVQIIRPNFLTYLNKSFNFEY